MISFKFKASRNYLHGTDIFNEVNTRLENEYITDISFRRSTKHHCWLSSVKEKDAVAIIKSQSRVMYLVESDELITERYSFDEDSLVESAVISDKKISMNLNEGFSFIENVVALTKKLNISLDKPELGQWLFGQYKSNDDHVNFKGEIVIESSKRIKSKFSENLIYLNGNFAAKIMFIVGEP